LVFDRCGSMVREKQGPADLILFGRGNKQERRRRGGVVRSGV